MLHVALTQKVQTQIHKSNGHQSRQLARMATVALPAIKLRNVDRPHASGEMRTLFARLDQVRESERKRLAREIHDDLGQKLNLMRYEVALMSNQTQKSLAETSAKLLKQIDEVIDSVRAIVSDLRPAVLDLGLVAGVEWLTQDFRRRTGLVCQLNLGCADIDLVDARATTVFRIVQESLTNITRHAQASQVRIDLDQRDHFIHISVSDDGIGIPAEALRKPGSMGIAGMRERVRLLNGEISIASQPGHGTALSFTIPLGERRNR